MVRVSGVIGAFPPAKFGAADGPVLRPTRIAAVPVETLVAAVAGEYQAALGR